MKEILDPTNFVSPPQGTCSLRRSWSSRSGIQFDLLHVCNGRQL